MARKGRVRQTRTGWQNTFDPYPGMVNSISWIDRMPEVLHISMALAEYSYEQVQADFFRIADFVNARHGIRPEFHFNLTHTLKLMRDDPAIFEYITGTSFEKSFHEILFFYQRLIGIPRKPPEKSDYGILFRGYHLALKGRSDTAVLCKYIMMKYQDRNMRDLPEPFQFYRHTTVKEILSSENTSQVMARFPITSGTSPHIDTEFCHDLWMENYLFSPFIPEPDPKDMEKKEYEEIGFATIKDHFETIYGEFKNIRLFTVFERPIAEVIMGFVSRVSNFALEIMEFDRTFKGEIAELVLRAQLESFIIVSWMIHRKDPALFVRFREFSVGREVLFSEELKNRATTDQLKKEAANLAKTAIEDSGLHPVDVATERGEPFEMRLDHMADEVFGKDNMYYLLYKRLSDVTHGHWRIIARHHLIKSINPMHDGLYDYKENLDSYAGLLPSFMAVNTALELMMNILKDIEADDVKQLKENLQDFHSYAWKKYMGYYLKYLRQNPGETKKSE
jgi:hypothetical protein